MKRENMLNSDMRDKGEEWLNGLEMLCIRFSYLGVGADLAALTVIEAWGLYCYLEQLANG